MRYLVTHMSADTNKGDFAILMATIQALRKIGADEPLTVVSVERGNRFGDEDVRLTRALGVEIVGTLEPPRGASGSFPGWLLAFVTAELWLLLFRVGGSHSLRILPRGPRRFFSVFVEAEAVIAKGGSYLYSHGGLRQNLYLLRMLYPLRVAVAARRPPTLLGVSLGPFSSGLARSAVRRALSRAKFVYLREERSYAIARQELGLRREAVAVGPDIAFSLRVPAASNADRGAVGVTVRDLPFWGSHDPERSRETYRAAILRTLRDLLDRGAEQVIFVPQAIGDIPFARSLAGEIGDPDRVVALESDLSLEQLLALYGQLRFVVATRLHSVILAAVAGTPAVHIAYELQKGVGIMEMLGMSRWVIPATDLTDANLSEMVADLEQELEQVSGRLTSRLEDLRAELDELFEALPSSIE
jgi:polysaccharide pyruvyl transferase WcaK-like protein